MLEPLLQAPRVSIFLSDCMRGFCSNRQVMGPLQAKVIENTVPRPSVEALEERKRALRRVRTDPADCEAHIAHALLSEGLDLEALAAQVRRP